MNCAHTKCLVAKSRLILTPGTLLLLLTACSYDPQPDPYASQICHAFDNQKLSEPVIVPPRVVLEEPGTIIVLHGMTSTARDDGDSTVVEQTVRLPEYVDRATVFLNGWQLGYRGDDHHVGHLGMLIGRIRFSPGQITWRAACVLSDDNADDSYASAYFPTIIGWNSANLNAMIDHDDADSFCKSHEAGAADNAFFGDNDLATTALACFPSFLQNPGFASGRSVAILPRGFGFVWDGGDDHHLLQLAYNLESAAPFLTDAKYYKDNAQLAPLAAPPNGRVNGGFVSWNSYALMKDNKARRDFGFGELVSGMGGSDVEVIQPPFSIQPHASGGGGFSGAGEKSAQVVIENIPYACAVPMLTGWDIGYSTSDQHVREIGVWIDDVHYERPANAATGTLRYVIHAITKDNDDFPDNFFRHKVSILGLRPLTPEPQPKTGEPAVYNPPARNGG